VSVVHVEVLVEERSMAALLDVILPRMLGSTSWIIHEHQSKSELLSRLPARLKGYSAWLPPDARILVIVDRDSQDCRQLKQELEAAASASGLLTRTTQHHGAFSVVNRIAIEELEAWFFGDWKAVRAAYPRVPATIPNQATYRAPDAIAGGTWEAFERVLQTAGYFGAGGLRKVEAARAIAEHMDPARNTSPSFRALRAALAEMHNP
jgi:hypothetical protein